MLTRTKAVVAAGALMIALPAGAALADTASPDDVAVTAVTCDGTQQQIRQGNGPGTGECIATGDQAATQLQAHERAMLQSMNGECDGDGPHAGSGAGFGPGDGSGPAFLGAQDGSGAMNKARRGTA